MRRTSVMMAWTRALLSIGGPPNASAQHVALVLGTHMDGTGSSCWPSIQTLALEARLSHVTVGRRLTELETGGWIVRWRERGGQGWARWFYEATFPAELEVADYDPPWVDDPAWFKHQGCKRSYSPLAVATEKGRKVSYAPSAAQIPEGRKPVTEGQKLQDEGPKLQAEKVGKPVSTRIPNKDSIGGFHRRDHRALIPGAAPRAKTKEFGNGAPQLLHSDLQRKCQRLIDAGFDDVDEIVRQLGAQGATVEIVRQVLATQRS